MNQETWQAVDDYYASLLMPADAALDGALARSNAAGMPAINVAPNQGKFLHLLARLMGAKRILEIGTLGGYSTIWLARALPADGKLVTLEYEAKHAKVAAENLKIAGVDQLVEIRQGKAIDSLAALQAEGVEPFDLVFIDADKPSTADYFSAAMKLVKVGSAIIVDNAVRKGAIADRTSRDEGVMGIQRFNELISNDPRVSATAVQTVGSKGYDGFVIARVEML